MNEVINFRVDKKIKNEAKKIAKKMGLTLSDVLNVFLHSFIRDKELNINLEEPSNWLLNEIAEAEKDIIDNNVSPMFSDVDDAIKWLDNKNRKYANRV